MDDATTGQQTPKPTPVSPSETRVWDGAEAIPAAIIAAFIVGLPLRLLLPAETRFMLVSISLSVVASTIVFVMPGMIVQPAMWLMKGLAGLAASVASPAPALGRYVAVNGHAHGSGSSSALRRKIAKHEAGHAIAAKAVGGSVDFALLYDGASGGRVKAQLPNARAHLAFLLAGQYAVNSSEGASADNEQFREVLREFPSNERSREKAAAKREARRIVNSRSGEIKSYARKLEEKGRI